MVTQFVAHPLHDRRHGLSILGLNHEINIQHVPLAFPLVYGRLHGNALGTCAAEAAFSEGLRDTHCSLSIEHEPMAIDPKYLPEVFPKKARKITPRIPRHYGMSQEVYDLMPEGLIQNLTPIQVFVF
jgi:hypothetical protein